MRRVLKYLAIAVGACVALLLLAVGGLYAWSGRAIAKTFPLPTHAFSVPTDSATVARGDHVIHAIAKCADCHGTDFGGQPFIDDPAMGFLWAPNLTTGRGGVLGDYSDAELEVAVRHGLRRSGQRLAIMPSDEYQLMSDADLAAAIAYLRTRPPVDREPTQATSFGPVARALYAAGVLPLFPADKVTHASEVVSAPPVDSTVAYGAYLANGGCIGCHGAGLSGGRIPGVPPSWPIPANLTPTGLGHYTQADFITALREGKRPDGSEINPFMPIAATKRMTDVELVALYKYLQTVPAKEFGGR